LKQLFDTREPRSSWGSSVGVATVVAISYFLAARLSLFLLAEPDGVAVFWPAAGISSGTLIALGPERRLPVVAGVIVATVVANLSSDRNLSSSLVFALSNAGEAVLTAWLIERQFGPRFSLVSLPRVLGLLGAAAIGAAVSGIGGTFGFVLFHGATTPIATIWSHWFASDALGIIIVAPLMIGLVSAMREVPPKSELLEGCVALAALALISEFVVAPLSKSWATAIPLGLLFPLLLWLAARCRPVFSAAAACMIAITVVWTVTFRIGHFGDPSIPITQRILEAQLAILAATLCANVLAALFAQQRLHAAEVSDGIKRLQEALAAGSVIAFEWDARTRLAQRSPNARRILGSEALSAARFLARVHNDDRARFKASVYGVRPQAASYATSFRYLHPDGRILWLEETATAEFDAEGCFLRLKGLTRDITPHKQAEEHQDLLIKELDHRVKNVLARVAAVTMFTREGGDSIDEFVETLEGRIQSMAHAHALLSQGQWHGVGLADLISEELAHYSAIGNTVIGGPNVALTASATEAVAMVFHELVTNAEKYGALSKREGRISVYWDCKLNGTSPLKIEWREIGGPIVVAPLRAGYGTSLICNLIPHELGGTVALEFASEGVCCVIQIPLEHVVGDHDGPGLTFNPPIEPP
jgi:PAS domain S-box-containing protein